MITNDTTLLIKLPAELKGSFQGLCKARGVNVSEELRRFMADQVSGAAQGMTTSDKRPVIKSAGVKCNNTPDMFDDDQDCVTRAFNENYGHLHKNTLKSPLQAKSEPQTAISSAIKSQKLRKKAKKR